MADTNNCHGCKYLCELKKGPPGEGYCAHVVRSKSYQTSRVENGKLIPSSCARFAGMEHCELYDAGDYDTRFDGGK